MAFGFVKVPALFGVGRYTVTVELPAIRRALPDVGGHLPRHRDRQGQVDRRHPRRCAGGLTLESASRFPADVTAAVHSRSAVGEQFLELTPQPGRPATAPTLRDGDVIPVGKVQIPADIGHLLDATNRALQAIPQDNLRTVVDEADKAVGGLGPELSRIVDGSTALAIDAGKTIDPFTRLIDQSPPVLNSQVQTVGFDRDVGAAHGRRSPASSRRRTRRSPTCSTRAARRSTKASALFDRVAPALPVLLANLVSLGDIAVTYRNDIEQLLVLFPQGTAVMSAIVVPELRHQAGLPGHLSGLQPQPQPAAAVQHRVPAGAAAAAHRRDVDSPDRPAGELYCRLPQDSTINVRGVRNIPCETNPAKRAPTVEMCESNEQYVPLNDGFNWKGDPNATLSGQGVPQFPKAGHRIRRASTCIRPLIRRRRNRRWPFPTIP